MLARTSRPAQIYRRGQVQTNDSVESASSDEDHGVQDNIEPVRPSPGRATIAAKVPLTLQNTQTAQQTIPDAPIAIQSPSGSSESSESVSEDAESDLESDSEPASDIKVTPLFRPIFMSKGDRGSDKDGTTTREEAANTSQQQVEAQKRHSHNLIAWAVKRDLEQREAPETFQDVNDADDEMDTAFEQWKLRELRRIKRDREALLQRGREKEEVDRRRALPEQQRLAEDMQHAERSRTAKPRGQHVFLQKYHHKGAFYADSDILKKHDFSAPTEGTVTTMDSLPEVMQVRDFGKMSRTKWTHLAKEDTTSMNSGWSASARGRQIECFRCGGPHHQRDCLVPTVSDIPTMQLQQRFHSGHIPKKAKFNKR